MFEENYIDNGRIKYVYKYFPLDNLHPNARGAHIAVDCADEVNNDILEAASYGATGTPTFLIGSEKDGFIKLVGAQPFAVFQNEINNQLDLHLSILK